MTNQLTLADYGWTTHFQSQLDLAEIGSLVPARVTAVHRGALELVGPGFAGRATPPPSEDAPEAQATVGDWVLIDKGTLRVRRVLARRSLFKRRAAGTDIRIQLIAANVDTLFIVSSCNQDFNPARIERYLALAREADVAPVIVLTKADLAGDAGDYTARAMRILPGVMAEALNALDPAEAHRLAPWMGRGQTVALIGSSGVGKSTLLNTLSGTAVQFTQGIREDDAKGRHTTTGRSLHRLASGAWLMDTPGMRELQLADVEAGIGEVFADVVELARQCKFSDCEHESEPGCAVKAAIESGSFDAERLKRYRKLIREDARNSLSIAEARATAKAFGKRAKANWEEKKRLGLKPQ